MLTTRSLALAAVLLVVLLGVVVLYWPGLDGPYLLDDQVNISMLYLDSFNWEAIRYGVTHNFSGMLGRPVSVFSLIFTGIVHGSGTWGYKYHNLLIHLLNGLLIFWLFSKLLARLPRCREQEGSHVTLAGIVATLWLVHPLMVSTVLYAVQRMAQLSALFTLAALLSYVYIREHLERGDRVFYIHVLFVFPALILLAVFSKENGALIPVYVLMLEWVVFGFAVDAGQARRRQLAFLGLYVAAPLLLGTAYVLYKRNVVFDYSTRDFNLYERLLSQVHIVSFYVKQILLPSLRDMSLFHDSWPVVRQAGPVTILLGGGWIALVWASVALRKRLPVLALGIGWFLVSHLMESTVFPLELVFEHRNYLASAGLLLLPVYFFYFVPRDYAKLRLVALVAVPLLVIMTTARVTEWRSEEMVYTVAVHDHPGSIRAQTAYASMQYNRGNVADAIARIEYVIEQDETEFGSALMNIYFLCDSGAEEEIRRLHSIALERAATYPISPYGFGLFEEMYRRLNERTCPELSPDDMLAVVRAAANQRDNLAGRDYRGYLQLHLGRYLYLAGDFGKGMEHMVNAYEITGQASILVELINKEIQLGSLDSAERLIEVLEEDSRAGLRDESLLIEIVRGSLREAKENAGLLP